MEVLLFQIGVFLLISYAGYKGFTQLNIVTVLVIIFTIVMVKTSPLMFLQFFTILFSYSFSFNRIKKANEAERNFHRQTVIKVRQKSSVEIVLRLLINLSILILIIFGFSKFSILYLEILVEMYILGSISYLLILGTAYLICAYFYLRIIELAKEFK